MMILLSIAIIVEQLVYECLKCIVLYLKEVLVWLTALQKELGGEVSDERMRDYIWNTLKSGRVRQHILLTYASLRYLIFTTLSAHFFSYFKTLNP